MPPLLADLDGYGICVSEKRARILAWRSESESEIEGTREFWQNGGESEVRVR